MQAPFHSALSYIATKNFVFGDNSYVPGNPFPMNRDGTAVEETVTDVIPARVFEQLLAQYRIAELSSPVAQAILAELEAEGADPAQINTPENPLAMLREPAAEPAPAAETDPAATDAADEAEKPPEGGAEGADEGTGGEGTGEGGGEQAPPPPAELVRPYTMAHTGFGKYTVTDANGAEVAKGLKKDPAEALVKG